MTYIIYTINCFLSKKVPVALRLFAFSMNSNYHNATPYTIVSLATGLGATPQVEVRALAPSKGSLRAPSFLLLSKLVSSAGIRKASSAQELQTHRGLK